MLFVSRLDGLSPFRVHKFLLKVICCGVLVHVCLLQINIKQLSSFHKHNFLNYRFLFLSKWLFSNFSDWSIGNFPRTTLWPFRLVKISFHSSIVNHWRNSCVACTRVKDWALYSSGIFIYKILCDFKSLHWGLNRLDIVVKRVLQFIFCVLISIINAQFCNLCTTVLYRVY